METLAFLEELANHTHYNATFNEIIAAQSATIKQAFLENNSSHMKALFSDSAILANTTHVVMTDIPA